MKKTRKNIFLGMVLFTSSLSAQESVNSSGGEATGAGGTVSYSVGQVVYTTNTGSNGSVAQGVQQPYEISTSGLTEVKGISLQISTYPNPVLDYLILKIEAYSNENYSFDLYHI